MVYQLLGPDFDDDVILHQSPLQYLLVGELECGLAPGSNSDVDGELLHISARGSEHVTRGNNRQRVTCTLSTPKACSSEPVLLLPHHPPRLPQVDNQGQSSRMIPTSPQSEEDHTYSTLASDASLDRFIQAPYPITPLSPWVEGKALEAWLLRP